MDWHLVSIFTFGIVPQPKPISQFAHYPVARKDFFRRPPPTKPQPPWELSIFKAEISRKIKAAAASIKARGPSVTT